ncbi:MAG: hypothetical protein IZT59_08970 [Verrucomicrobia bacterium]|jgi:hypothetical protein|nr:hypothetical protein [Verrucomicrobiota bacterium]|tara:strand:+ start:31625 stop:31882 length:258 start_codon:yes stop_codon:yes gene_type:complete
MASSKASFSITSILAIIAAILSFKVGAFGGLLLASIAFIFGVLGIVLALSPKTRGGGLSILAVILSFIGVIVAIIKAISWLVHLG